MVGEAGKPENKQVPIPEFWIGIHPVTQR
jgi:formylglycine-generating enzyme